MFLCLQGESIKIDEIKWYLHNVVMNYSANLNIYNREEMKQNIQNSLTDPLVRSNYLNNLYGVVTRYMSYFVNGMLMMGDRHSLAFRFLSVAQSRFVCLFAVCP